MIEIRESRTRSKPCAGCGGQERNVVDEYRNGYLFRTTWTCPCGRASYHWEWGSTCAAARECRAMGGGTADQRPGVTGAEPTPPPTVEARAKTNEDIAREIGHWPDGTKPRPKQEQMRLW